MIADFLREHFSVKMEATYEWGKNSNGNLFRYDIEVVEKSCVVEVDGPQHFTNMHQWHSIATTVIENDILKMNAAVLNNMRVVRICQADVWNNVFEWKALLLNAVNSSTLVSFIANDSSLYDSHHSNLGTTLNDFKLL